MSTSNHSLLSLILCSLVGSSLSQTLVHDATTLYSSENRADLKRHSEEVSINDTNGRLSEIGDRWLLLRNRQDAAVVVEGDPIITQNVRQPQAYETSIEERTRDKRMAPPMVAVMSWLGMAIFGSIVATIYSGKPTITVGISSDNFGGASSDNRFDQHESLSDPSEKGGDIFSYYKPPPKMGEITGFPDLVTQKPLGGRKRWKDSKTGETYEWDSQHGDLEGYGKNKDHIGSFDPKTGEKTKGPVKGRRLKE